MGERKSAKLEGVLVLVIIMTEDYVRSRCAVCALNNFGVLLSIRIMLQSQQVVN